MFDVTQLYVTLGGVSVLIGIISTLYSMYNINKNNVRKENDTLNDIKSYMNQEFIKLNLKQDSYCDSIKTISANMSKMMDTQDDLKKTIVEHELRIQQLEKK